MAIHIKKSREGTYGSHSVKQMERDKAKGGAIGKKANFALNARKWNHSKGARKARGRSK